MKEDAAAKEEKPRRHVLWSVLSFFALTIVSQAATSSKWWSRDLYIAIVAIAMVVGVALNPRESLSFVRRLLSLGPFRLPATTGFVVVSIAVVLPWYEISWFGPELEVDGFSYPAFAAGLFAVGVFGVIFAAFSTRFGEAGFCVVLAGAAVAIAYYLSEYPRFPATNDLPFEYRAYPPSSAEFVVLDGLRVLLYGSIVALAGCLLWAISRLFHREPAPETFPRFQQDYVRSKDEFPRFNDRFPRL